MNDGSVSEDLYHLLAAYLHQDWDIFAEDWPGVIDVYVSDEQPSPSSLRAIADEINTLVVSRSEPQLTQLVSYTIGVDYDPRPLTYKEWLGQIAERLRRHADGIVTGDGLSPA